MDYLPSSSKRNIYSNIQKGGPGSGFRGHKGRKGKRGGSLPSKGTGSVNSFGKQVDLSPISKELVVVTNFLNSNKALFSGASLTGSWAMQDPNRMPDRRGKGTSDIDIMLHSGIPSWKDQMPAWDALAELEIKANEAGTHQVHLNLAPILRHDVPYVTIFGETKTA